VCIFCIHLQLVTVQAQENVGCKECNAFISVSASSTFELILILCMPEEWLTKPEMASQRWHLTDLISCAVVDQQIVRLLHSNLFSKRDLMGLFLSVKSEWDSSGVRPFLKAGVAFRKHGFMHKRERDHDSNLFFLSLRGHNDVR